MQWSKLRRVTVWTREVGKVDQSENRNRICVTVVNVKCKDTFFFFKYQHDKNYR